MIFINKSRAFIDEREMEGDGVEKWTHSDRNFSFVILFEYTERVLTFNLNKQMCSATIIAVVVVFFRRGYQIKLDEIEENQSNELCSRKNSN